MRAEKGKIGKCVCSLRAFLIDLPRKGSFDRCLLMRSNLGIILVAVKGLPSISSTSFEVKGSKPGAARRDLEEKTCRDNGARRGSVLSDIARSLP